MNTARGVALLEALVAFALLALAIAGAMGAASVSRHSAADAGARENALQEAAARLEGLRSFTGAESTPPGAAFADIVGAAAQTVTKGPHAFRVDTTIVDDGAARLKAAAVRVRWTDRAGAEQGVQLATAIDGALPAHSALLTLPAPPGPAARPLNRHGMLPPSVRITGAARGAWSAGSVGPTFVVDTVTGAPIARCPGRAEPSAGCTLFEGVWLAGHVRFALQSPPDAHTARDAPLPFRLRLDGLSAGATASCEVSPMPADGHTRFACVVPLPADGRGWSGRLDLVPDGWTLGRHRSHFRVCRYSIDLDGSGAVDRNDEHPAAYTGVTASLVQQNFLVVRGDQPCPADPAPPHNAGSAHTVDHQP